VIVAPSLALSTALWICAGLLPAVQLHEVPEPLQVALAFELSNRIKAAKANKMGEDLSRVIRLILHKDYSVRESQAFSLSACTKPEQVTS